MGLVTYPGTWVASRLVHRLGDTRHGMLIECLIATGGVVFIVQGIRAWVYAPG